MDTEAQQSLQNRQRVLKKILKANPHLICGTSEGRKGYSIKIEGNSENRYCKPIKVLNMGNLLSREN